MSCYKISQRAKIYHEGDIPPSVVVDLERLNYLAARDELDENSLKSIDTEFFIGGTRGIHYDTQKWSKKTRSLHRKENEADKPLYSEAVYKRAGFDSIPLSLSPKESIRVHRHGVILQHQIECLRYTGGISDWGRTKFKHALYALQHLYTNSYYEHKKKCQEVYEKKKNNVPITEAIDVALLFSVGEANYNLSIGDTPYHAMRYALGSKYYPGQEAFRLRPRWDKNQNPEFPYSGKVYLMLFSLKEYLALNPNHLGSLNAKREISILAQINKEHETTFKALIPAKNIVDTITLKYPSFCRPYNLYYLKKYGLNKTLYEEFKKKLSTAMPHAKEDRDAKFMLAEHLCAFYEPAIIERLRVAAKNRVEGKQGWLIYRNDMGGFSFSPPELVSDNTGKRKEAGNKKREMQAILKEERKKLPDGPLEKLMKNYSVIAAENIDKLMYHVFKKNKRHFNKKTKVEWDNNLIKQYFIEEVQDSFTHHNEILEAFKLIVNYLYNAAILTGSTIVLRSFLFKADKMEPEESLYEFLYSGGDSIYYLTPKTTELSMLGVKRTQNVLNQNTIGFILFSPPEQKNKHPKAEVPPNKKHKTLSTA